MRYGDRPCPPSLQTRSHTLLRRISFSTGLFFLHLIGPTPAKTYENRFFLGLLFSYGASLLTGLPPPAPFISLPTPRQHTLLSLPAEAILGGAPGTPTHSLPPPPPPPLPPPLSGTGGTTPYRPPPSPPWTSGCELRPRKPLLPHHSAFLFPLMTRIPLLFLRKGPTSSHEQLPSPPSPLQEEEVFFTPAFRCPPTSGTESKLTPRAVRNQRQALLILVEIRLSPCIPYP